MKFDAKEIKKYERNKHALEHFGIHINNGDTRCYFSYPGHEKEYKIWFNYEAKTNANGKLINPSSNNYLNIYSDNNNLIEQRIPHDKPVYLTDDNKKRIVFKKTSKTCAIFVGVYELVKREGHNEFYKRISTTFDTNNVNDITPPNSNSKSTSINSLDDDVEKIVLSKEDKNENRLDDDLNDEVANIPLSELQYKEYQPKIKELKKTSSYERNRIVAINALYKAKGMCALDANHESFLKPDGSKYLEVHHLIPMKAQKNYREALDREENVVCLCANCHRKIHYGKERYEMLEKLYRLKAKGIKDAGIYISLNSLYSNY